MNASRASVSGRGGRARLFARAAHVRGRRPLVGRRILVTRPRAQSRALCDALRRLGADPVPVPVIDIVPPGAGGRLDRALRTLGRYDWVVLTSANGALACLARARALGLGLRSLHPPRWAAVGPATASTLRSAGIKVAMIPSRFLTRALARELRDVDGRRILLPRASAAGATLARVLRARGAVVEQIAAYRTVVAPRPLPAEVARLIDARAIDTVLFTSASTVRGLVRMLGKRRRSLKTMTIACIGPVCAAAVRRQGLRPHIVADEHTTNGLIKALIEAPPKGAHNGQDRAPR